MHQRINFVAITTVSHFNNISYYYNLFIVCKLVKETEIDYCLTYCSFNFFQFVYNFDKYIIRVKHNILLLMYSFDRVLPITTRVVNIYMKYNFQ